MVAAIQLYGYLIVLLRFYGYVVVAIWLYGHVGVATLLHGHLFCEYIGLYMPRGYSYIVVCLL